MCIAVLLLSQDINRVFHTNTPRFGGHHKASPYEFIVCMDHAIIFKGTRSSVAAPHPFDIPLLAFVGRIPRTGFAGCYGRPS